MSARIIRPGHRGLRGYFASRKTLHPVAFESRLERDQLILLEADPAVVTFDTQPVTIPFRGRERARSYTPDCRVIYQAAPTELVEVKYAADIAAYEPKARADMEEAHDAARSFCDARSWRFVLRTDRDILGPRLDRAHALRAFARLPASVASGLLAVESFVRQHPGVALGELARELDPLGPTTRNLALHLVWHGRLRDEPFATPTDATRLFAAEVSQ